MAEAPTPSKVQKHDNVLKQNRGDAWEVFGDTARAAMMHCWMICDNLLACSRLRVERVCVSRMHVDTSHKHESVCSEVEGALN